MLKGSDGINSDDLTVIAENELLSAASAIDADAQRLAQLKLRKSESDDHAQFDELIVEACKSITAATSALVKAALSAQRELVSTGKNSGRPLSTSDDRQWSEGVVSAARLVALATHSLYESVNVFAKGGQATEEQFISFAKQVANSTAQLLEACKVKADQNSSGMKKLQVAGNAVKQATDNLVEAVQKAVEKEKNFHQIVNKKMMDEMAQEINAREEVIRLEREVVEARVRLAAIKRANYTGRLDDK